MLYIILALAPAVLALLYAALEHWGFFDWITGRTHALDGLERLKSGKGFPATFIYENGEDTKCFSALERRISRRVRAQNPELTVFDGSGPSCITVAGAPIVLSGLPDDWDAGERRVYLSGHPVMYLFGVTRQGGQGKASRVCSLGDVEKWLSEEKDNRKFVLGVIAIGLISMALLLLKLGIAG